MRYTENGAGKGIQKGVGISNLEKRFIVFAVKTDDAWRPELINNFSDEEQLIFNSKQFETYSIDIDFNKPELYNNTITDHTLDVEKECPVAKHFGVEGIGEGIVWVCEDHPDLIFKTKGEKHSVSKVHSVSSVDTAMIEEVYKFVDLAVTDNRLIQGISHLKEYGLEISEKSTGDFLRWVVKDVIKEEEDTIVANQLDIKKINSAVSKKARMWFFEYLNFGSHD